jgi:hypothetical protein
VNAFPVRPTIPSRPAAYIRDADATATDDPTMTELRDMVISMAEGLGWPGPTVYADAGQPGSQLAALTEAITAGHHDGVFAAHPAQISHDLAELGAFDQLCRQHGVRLRFRWCQELTDTRALFDVIRDARDFTVTDEHVQLLRRTHITWDGAEFGAPEIDPKRPYGNSDVFGDIAEILGVPKSEWADGEWGPFPDAEWRFLRLHVETAIALQIALATGEFRPGRYVRGDKWDSRSWKRAEA